MESLRKGYQTRIREEMMSAAGDSRIKLYQEYFQVSKISVKLIITPLYFSKSRSIILPHFIGRRLGI